jgi:hypothetical protein
LLLRGREALRCGIMAKAHLRTSVVALAVVVPAGGSLCLNPSWSGHGHVGSCCALAALAGAGGGSGNCAIG